MLLTALKLRYTAVTPGCSLQTNVVRFLHMQVMSRFWSCASALGPQ